VSDMRSFSAALFELMIFISLVEGAVAIRLDYKSTSFCFLTAHLAAGHSNIEERNQDYFTISDGLHFARGKMIGDHESVPLLASLQSMMLILLRPYAVVTLSGLLIRTIESI